jgi:uncharacterized membrane protein YcaP (DUF421 family)/predicted RNA-binding Zn-ribbon protein involved in translation (DUF1610 family)
MDYTFDLERIFFGNLSWLLLFEIVLRTVVLYIYALFMLRLLGKRGMGNLSPFELAIIIALGSAVGDPMFYPDVPLVHGMIVMTVIVLLQRGVTWLSRRNQRVEAFVESRASCLVADGRLVLDALNREMLAQQELFTALRKAGVVHLGQVKRAYLESTGQLSVFKYPLEEERPGLSLLPGCGDGSRSAEFEAGDPVVKTGSYACYSCGQPVRLASGQAFSACPRCGHDVWALASTRPFDTSVSFGPFTSIA